MKTTARWLFLGLIGSWMAAGLGGCANVPVESVAVNEQVTAGIGSMEENSYRLIDGWRETAIKVLENRFEDIYDQAEERYRQRRGIPTGRALTPDQARDVTGLVLLVNNRVQKRIDAKARELEETVQTNAQTLKATNDNITALLKSAQSVIGGREVLLREAGTIIPIPIDFAGFIDGLIGEEAGEVLSPSS